MCILCSREERFHPQVGAGYTSHPFEPAERRKLVRRMEDREQVLDEIVRRHSKAAQEGRI